MRRALVAIAFLITLPITAMAQGSPTVVTACGAVQAGIYNPGGSAPPTVDQNGNLCVGDSGGGGDVTVSVAPLTYVTPDSVSVGTTSGTLAASGKYKTSLQVCTLPASTTNVWLNPRGAAAVVSAGIPVFAGGRCTNFGTQALPVPTAAITAITDSGSAQTVTMAGG